MGTHIPFTRTDGKKAQGYLAKAAKANAPGVVVIQEWWGLAGNITALCDRLALAGYDALAPDLYGGTLVPYHDHHAAEAELKKLDFADAAQNAVRGAAQFLKRSSPKVAVVGFCGRRHRDVVSKCARNFRRCDVLWPAARTIS